MSHSHRAKPIPEGHEGAIPYLCCKDAAHAIEFYKRAFDAREVERFPMPDGKIGHAEIKIGKAVIMLADEFPEIGVRCPASIGGSAVTVMIYVNDVDTVVKRAVAAGAKITTPLDDRFYGDRNCKIEDPFGHTWMISTHKEDVSFDELKKRALAMFDEP
jgi:PhnB protein